MIADSPRILAGLTGLLLPFCTCSASAQLFLGDITLHPSDLSVNQLTLQAASEAGPLLLAYETTGAVLSHRIELRFAADLEFSVVATPPDWQVQTSLVTESGVSVQVATYFYTGTSSTNAAEFFDFANAWQASFRLREPVPAPPGTSPPTIPVSVEVNASSVIPGLGTIPASDSFALASTLTSILTQREFSFCLEGGNPAGLTLGFNFSLPGIQYCIESTEDLRLYTKRTTFTTPVPLTDPSVPLEGEWKAREFFRIRLLPVQSSP